MTTVSSIEKSCSPALNKFQEGAFGSVVGVTRGGQKNIATATSAATKIRMVRTSNMFSFERIICWGDEKIHGRRLEFDKLIVAR